jgi:ABC-2 type transport system permease protein
MGPFSVAVAASEQTVSGETRIAWFASSSFLMEEIDGMVGGNNRDLVLNTIGWMTGQDQGISIRPRTTSSPVLRLTAAQAARWCILFTAVIPVCILGTGIAVCVGRRRRQ